MSGGSFGVGVARADGAPPPLSKPSHGRVVKGHLGVDPEHLPAALTHAQAEIRLLAGDQIGVVPPHLLDGGDAHEGVAAAGIRVAHGRVPLHVAEAVVDRRLGVALATPATHDGELRIGEELSLGRLQPAIRDDAIAVDELDQLQLGRGVAKSREPAVSGAGRRERNRSVELDDERPHLFGQRHATVRRAGVHVHDRRGAPGERREAAAQPLTLVSTDRDDTDARVHGPGGSHTSVEPHNNPGADPSGDAVNYTAPAMRLAYLMSQYPYASTTFIRREIVELEKLGFTVDRIAIRPTEHPLRDENDLAEAAKTACILRAGALRLLINMLRVLVTRPVAFTRALALTWKMARRSPRGLLVHLAYLAEACTALGWLVARKVEHVHAHFATNPVAVAMLVRVLGGPTYSFTVHGPEDFDLAHSLSLDEKIARARFVVAISHFARSQLYRWCGHEDWPKIQIVRCGVTQAFLGASIPTISVEPRLLNIGRLCNAKGQLLLVEAAHRLAEEGLPFVIDVVGDGELRAPLEELIARYGLAGHVRLLGWQTETEVREHIVRARALVLPSFAEGLPVVLMETLALGRPVIATAIAGVSELVRPGENGWLIPAGSVEALVVALREVLSAPSERLAQLGRSGAILVAQQHDVALEAQKLAALYRGKEAGRAEGADGPDSDDSGRRAARSL
jgi:colanic acid/amylovoran biosynthesis glycosyltransferase